MRVAIVGAGSEGLSAFRYWQTMKDEVTLLDRVAGLSVPTDAKAVLGPDYLKDLDSYDLVVRSPQVKPRVIRTKKPVTSTTQEFFRRCPARIIGVTGTRGKTTVVAMIAKILAEAGKRTWVGGGSKEPALDFLSKVKASDLVVLELSSFRLMDLDTSPHIAVCLDITSAHLDWHQSMREYLAAMGNIFWHQRPGDVAVYNAANDFSTQVGQLSPGEHIPYLEAPGARVADGRIKIGPTSICGVGEIGGGNPEAVENMCAAITATWQLVRQDVAAVRRAVKVFNSVESI